MNERSSLLSSSSKRRPRVSTPQSTTTTTTPYRDDISTTTNNNTTTTPPIDLLNDDHPLFVQSIQPQPLAVSHSNTNEQIIMEEEDLLNLNDLPSIHTITPQPTATVFPLQQPTIATNTNNTSLESIELCTIDETHYNNNNKPLNPLMTEFVNEKNQLSSVHPLLDTSTTTTVMSLPPPDANKAMCTLFGTETEMKEPSFETEDEEYGVPLPVKETIPPNNDKSETARLWFGGSIQSNSKPQSPLLQSRMTPPRSNQSDHYSNTTTTTTTTYPNHNNNNNNTNTGGIVYQRLRSLRSLIPPTPPHNTTTTSSSMRMEQEEQNYVVPQEAKKSMPQQPQWNMLNVALCVSLGFTTAASCVPISILPTIATMVYNDNPEEQSLLISRITYSAVLGTSAGKFINGPLGDVVGARYLACSHALGLTASLLLLSCSGLSITTATYACVAVEFYQSVQWPCVTILLATHYANNGDAYETSVYLTSLGSRCGSLLAGFTTTLLLRHDYHWTTVCRFASLSSLIGFSILYLFVQDSPTQLHEPQNPIKESVWPLLFPQGKRRSLVQFGINAWKVLYMIFMRNVVPSLRSVMFCGTFWVVAIAHSGGSMVASSVRILGTYFRDTSNGYIQETQAGVVTLFLSVGVLFGLYYYGKAFSLLRGVKRKDLVLRLYVAVVAMCYTLALLAVPMIRNAIYSPVLVALLQAMATFIMGAAVAVQVFCIPAIIASTFGANKGLYAAYTDGVAFLVSSMVWRIVGTAVEEGNPQGAGWAYGWAAVALLVIFAGWLMVEFVGHYFCRTTSSTMMNNIHHSSSSTTITQQQYKDKQQMSNLLESNITSFSNNSGGGSLFKESTSTIVSTEKDATQLPVLFEDPSSEMKFEMEEEEEVVFFNDDATNKERILALLDKSENEYCVDCKRPYPRWASIIMNHDNIGCFCCTECAGSHRKLGTHVLFVRSIDHDTTFKTNEVTALENGGNNKVNKLYEALLIGESGSPTALSTASEREEFIIAKYQKKHWYRAPCNTESTVLSDTTFTPINTETASNSIELVQNTLVMQKNPPLQNNLNVRQKNYNRHNKVSVFDQQAPFDRTMRMEYESFVSQGEETASESGGEMDIYNNHSGEDGDVSDASEDSDAWHDGRRGLSEIVSL